MQGNQAERGPEGVVCDSADGGFSKNPEHFIAFCIVTSRYPRRGDAAGTMDWLSTAAQRGKDADVENRSGGLYSLVPSVPIKKNKNPSLVPL